MFAPNAYVMLFYTCTTTVSRKVSACFYCIANELQCVSMALRRPQGSFGVPIDCCCVVAYLVPNTCVAL